MKTDVYSRVTDKILADLERGNLIWLQPWQAGHAAGPISRPLRSMGKPYRGINVIMLWASAMERGFSCLIWITYKQAQEQGGQVRKGEKGFLVIYADTFTKKDANEQGESVETEIPFMKGYTVFNAEQIDGLPAHYYAQVKPDHNGLTPQESCDRFFAATGAAIRHGGNRAFYNIASDFVQMPEFQSFRDELSYYATLAHEMTYWTRHESRLNRDLAASASAMQAMR